MERMMKKEDARYQAYRQILEEELIPAMGCTEPIAIAYAAAKARAKEAMASNEARKASGEALFTPLPVSDGVMVFEKEGK